MRTARAETHREDVGAWISHAAELLDEVFARSEGQIAGEWTGLENHLNFVHRPGGWLSEDEALGLTALFNSRVLDAYFRVLNVLNGNTQVNATDIRAMPLPSLAKIKVIGVAIREGATPEAVEEMLSVEA